jgi:hypothetical protein
MGPRNKETMISASYFSKQVNHKTVLIKLTVTGAQYADWQARHTGAKMSLISDGWSEIDGQTYLQNKIELNDQTVSS